MDLVCTPWERRALLIRAEAPLDKSRVPYLVEVLAREGILTK